MDSTAIKISKASSYLVGTSYEEANCWDIAVEFYKQVYGATLLNYCNGVNIEDRRETESLIYAHKGEFEEVPLDCIRPGDIIVLRVKGIESHIAISLPSMTMLHTDKKKGCHIDRLDRWLNTVSGIYRLKANIND